MIPSPESSVIFSVNGFDIHYYGVIMFFAIISALLVIREMCKRYYKDVSTDILLDILPIIIITAIIGARLYYVVMDIAYYINHPLEIFAVWNGGLSIHGALIGGIGAGFFLAKKHKISFLRYADVFSYGLVIGQAIGRFGNYFNCEAFGKPCNLLFKLFIPMTHRPDEFMDVQYFHPTFLYESFWDITVFLILFFVIRKIGGAKDGTVFFSYLILYSIGRIFIEQLRLDSVLNICGIPVAQIVSALIIVVSACALFLIYKR